MAEKRKKITDDELMMEGYQALYAAATPSADFKSLVDNCTRYMDREGDIHNTETPLTNEECRTRGWQKDIEYMNYSLDRDVYEQIIDDIIKKYNLKGLRAQAFKNTMYLGCGPKFA